MKQVMHKGIKLSTQAYKLILFMTGKVSSRMVNNLLSIRISKKNSLNRSYDY